MAYSFVPPGGGAGFGGGIFSQGMGTALLNANNAGIDLAQKFRQYQDQNMLDQFAIPAKEAQLDATRLGAAADVMDQQAVLNSQMAMAGTPAGPNIAPVGAPGSPIAMGGSQNTIAGLQARQVDGVRPMGVGVNDPFGQMLTGYDAQGNPYTYQHFDPNAFADPNAPRR